MRISAKKLGGVAMKDFCPRCFWTLMHMEGDPPFQFFPSIFGKIDGFNKHVIHTYVERHKKLPPSLSELGDIDGYIEPPHHSQFQLMTSRNVLLTGTPDLILRLADGTLLIGDYKTAAFHGDADPLYAIYQIQLNAYGILAEHNKLGEVSGLALLYAEPCTTREDACGEATHTDDGFRLEFRVKVLTVPLNGKVVVDAVQVAKEVFDLSKAPEGLAGCKNCQKMQALIAAVNAGEANIYSTM